MRTCNSKHKRCQLQLKTPLPTRILVISEDSHFVRLAIIEEQHAPYVALSYPWGGKIDFLTTKATLEARKQGFSRASLPQTLQDAIIVSHRLRIRRLWVDCLCIIQDSKEDMAREVSQMHKIYQNATLTISASNARSAYSGFLNHHYDDSASQKLPFCFPNGTTGHIYVRQDTVYSEIGRPLDQRAWTLEERFLSRRLLEYDLIMNWRCQETFEQHGGEKNYAYSPDRGNLELIRLLNTSDELAKIDIREIRRFWSYIIGDYTARQLTKDKDRLPAIGGLALQIRHHMGGEYIAGLWSRYLELGLLWSGNIQPTSRDRQGSAWDDPTIIYRPQKYRAPSWSWTSVEGRVDSWHRESVQDLYQSSSEKTEITMQVLDYNIQLKSPVLPFGELTGGTLAVTGHVVSTLLEPRPFEDMEIQLGNGLISVHPDDFHEWNAAVKYSTVYALEILRRSSKVTLKSSSKGLILRKSSSGRYKRLGCFSSSFPCEGQSEFEKVTKQTLIIE